MKLVKIIGGLLALIIVIVIGLFIYGLSNINALVKQAVETVGPQVTETRVELNSVDIDLLDGKAQLDSFLIGNPQGFSSNHLLKWNQILLQIDPQSIRSDVIVIKNIVIDGVNINAEQKGLNTNLQDLMKTLQGDSAPSSDEPSDESNTSDIRLALEKLRFNNNEINLITEKYGVYKLVMPDFSVANIGDKSTGLTPEEFGMAILKPLVKQAQKAVENRVKGLAKEQLEAKFEEKKEEAKAKAEAKKEALEAKADEEKDALKDKLDDKLKGLLDR